MVVETVERDGVPTQKKFDMQGFTDFVYGEAENLLQQAEARLKARSSISDLQPNSQIEKLRLPQTLSKAEMPQPHYVVDGDGIARMNKKYLVPEEMKNDVDEAGLNEDPATRRRRIHEEKKATAGPQWFDMPKTDLTPELKRDLQILHMREVLDPHRHYKKERGKMRIPEFSQIGTLHEGPTEYYSARLNKSDRKRTLVEEVLADEKKSGMFKTKYNTIQERKRSGKKGFVKAQMRKKYGDRSKV